MTTFVRRLEMYMTDVSPWMAANRLKLNDDKTKLLLAGSSCGSATLGRSGPSIQLGDKIITASNHVRYSRCHHLVEDLSPERHAAVIISARFYVLRQLNLNLNDVD